MLTRRHRRRLLIAVATLIASLGTASWIVGGRLLGPVNRPVGPPPSDLPAEPMRIASKSGSELAGWYVPAAGANATIVLLHPIRGDRTTMLSRARLLHDAGYAVVLMDLQAHGDSPGDAITLGFLEKFDAAAAVDFACKKSPGHRIGVLGWSLGGAAALLASPLDIDALVLEAVYPTVDEAVHDRLAMRIGPLHHLAAPLLLWQLGPRLGVARADLRPIDRIAHVGCPVLVAAGELDEHTTLAESRRMFDAAGEPKELVTFPGARHEDLLAFDADRYRAAVLPFLARWLHAGE